MSSVYYRLPAAVAASLSLLLVACSSSPPPQQAKASATQSASTGGSDANDLDSNATLWTWLGLADSGTKHRKGPHTGPSVSPILWQAAENTLKFVPLKASDAQTGTLETKWYSPQDKPNERVAVDVFILSRALTSAALVVNVRREVRSDDGEWVRSTVDRQVVDHLTNDILHEAQRLHRAWYPES